MSIPRSFWVLMLPSIRLILPVACTPAPSPPLAPLPWQVLPSTRARLSTWMPSPVLPDAVQPVTALPAEAIIPIPVFPLALQLLTVLEPPTEIPPPRFSSPVEPGAELRVGPAMPNPVLKCALQSTTVRLLTQLVLVLAPPL